MSRIETIADGVTLYLGDCRDILPLLGPVDAVVTDPPYGIDFVRGAGGTERTNTAKGRRLSGGIFGDQEPFDPAHLITFPQVLLWGADHFYPRLPDSGRFLAWDKRKGWDFKDDFSDVEFAWHSKEGAARIINYLWKGVRQDGEKGIRKFHVMQKPIAVMAWCIDQLHGEVNSILDPYMGSGTTGVAAVRRGKRFVGIEIEAAHFDVACKRVDEATKQPDLFVSPATQPATQITWDEMWKEPYLDPQSAGTDRG